MNKRQRIEKLNNQAKYLIKKILKQNGCDDETVRFLLSDGRLSDLDEYVDDLEEIEEVVFA